MRAVRGRQVEVDQVVVVRPAFRRGQEVVESVGVTTRLAVGDGRVIECAGRLAHRQTGGEVDGLAVRLLAQRVVEVAAGRLGRG